MVAHATRFSLLSCFWSLLGFYCLFSRPASRPRSTAYYALLNHPQLDCFGTARVSRHLDLLTRLWCSSCFIFACSSDFQDPLRTDRTVPISFIMPACWDFRRMCTRLQDLTGLRRKEKKRTYEIVGTATQIPLLLPSRLVLMLTSRVTVRPVQLQEGGYRPPRNHRRRVSQFSSLDISPPGIVILTFRHRISVLREKAAASCLGIRHDHDPNSLTSLHLPHIIPARSTSPFSTTGSMW